MSRRTSLAVIWAAYLWTIAVSWAVASFLPVESPLYKAAAAYLVATVMIFVFSVIFDNSSIYDPFWSVAPILLSVYWTIDVWDVTGGNPRALLVVTLVTIWGVRLTANFLTHWRGMRHEDWRYSDFRDRTKSTFWLVSFFGFHLAPSAIVFAACLPVSIACTSATPFGAVDVAATGVTLLAIIIESLADAQMRRAVAAGDFTTATFRGGLWAYSRHPNYFGEVLFWWGLYLFSLAADIGSWWTVLGPLGVTCLFLFVSLPLIESRMRRRRPDFNRVREQIPALFPRFPRNE